MYDIIIIGAGVVGSLLARKLSSYELSVLVIEKENDVGNATSEANSAVVHSGYDPEPGTLKAKLNVLGNKMFPKICEELDVHLNNIGSLTVAIYDEQLKILEDLKKRAEINGVEVKLLNKEETLEIEPNLSSEVKGSLFAPTAGVVNPFTLVVHAIENAVDNGVKLALDEKVVNIVNNKENFEVITDKNSYVGRIVVDCAGVYSDEIHSLVEPIDYEINPRKGEYFVLDHYGQNLVNHTIFPLPSEKGKGVLVTPTTSNNFLVGPSSEYVKDKEDTSTDKETLDKVKASAKLLVPNIPFQHAIRTFSGLRSTPSTHDFIIRPSKVSSRFIVAAGIESPGLVSSPAIAEYIVNNFISKEIELKTKISYNPYVRKRIRMNELSVEKRNAYIKKHPEYGKIVCNCEKVSLGEILDELNSSVPPKTIKAVKKRTRAGFGKCQGGFCQPLVLRQLAKYLKKSKSEIMLDKKGSFIARYLTKEDKE